MNSAKSFPRSNCHYQRHRQFVGYTHHRRSAGGQCTGDIYSGGAVTNFEILYKGKVLDSLKSALILPEIIDESKWYGGKHCYNDPEQHHVFIYLANPTSSSIYFNTNLVNPKERP